MQGLDMACMLTWVAENVGRWTQTDPQQHYNEAIIQTAARLRVRMLRTTEEAVGKGAQAHLVPSRW